MLVGYLANNVLPARLGELFEPLPGDREGISRSATLGTSRGRAGRRYGGPGRDRCAQQILISTSRGVVVSAILVGVAVARASYACAAVALAAHRLPEREGERFH